MGRRNAFNGDRETVYNRCVRDDPIESPVTLRRNPPVVEQVDVETFAAVTSKLFGDDGDPDPGGPSVPSPVQERPIATSDVQNQAAPADANDEYTCQSSSMPRT